jgi:hypothetical protein
MEAFFSSVKSELGDRFDSCGEATMELFDYIEGFYNQRRRHSTPGSTSQFFSGRLKADESPLLRCSTSIRRPRAGHGQAKAGRSVSSA